MLLRALDAILLGFIAVMAVGYAGPGGFQFLVPLPGDCGWVALS